MSRYPYATTHPLEIVEILLDGRPVEAIRKDLAPSRVLPAARGVRPPEIVDSAREASMYSELLAHRPLAPVCFESGTDDAGPWLLLERIQGIELWQVGDLGVWVEVARWLADAHDALSRSCDAPVPFLRYDRAFYERWLDRATAFATGAQTAALKRLAPCHGYVVDTLLAMRQTVIHGDFTPSNVLVATDDGSGVRVVDWELAALGPPLVDLASLCSGWPEHDRLQIAESYARAAGEAFDDAFIRDLDCCEFHLCMQWIGWSPRWASPSEHAHDWLGRAIHLADALAPYLGAGTRCPPQARPSRDGVPRTTRGGST
jgi:hypothetical protein